MAAKTISSGSTYSTGFTITTADGNGFALTNNGVIGSTGAGFGLVVQTSGDFVYNAGKILASTSSGDGIVSGSPVRILNRSGGLISAAYGIRLSGGGTIVNASGGSITGARDPIYASGTSVYVENLGVITGTGTSNTQGGVVLNAGGYVYNKPGGTISGANGVFEGVSAKVRNEGTIIGNNADGVELNAGGTVTTETQTPNSAATISGGYAGIVINGAPGYVLDGSGQISGGTGGVFLQAGGYIHQIGGPGGGAGGGTIAANYAVAINNGSGTVETGGRILGGALGVGMDGAGPHKVTLSSIGATISGAKAISISGGPGYIYDRGTINGASGTAVILPAGYNNVLEIYSGAKVYGQVNGGNFQDGPHTTTLLLAQGYSTGVFTGFGSRYYNIGNVTVKSGANWTMDGSNTFVDPSFVGAGATTFLPVTLLDAGTLTFGGTEFSRLTLGSNAHLTVSKGGVLTPAYLSQAIYAPTGIFAPTVVTDGQITAAGNDGIRLDDGGTVTNQADGVIAANSAGVRIENAKGTVTNLGQIKATLSAGVALNTGGSVANTLGSVQGTIQGTVGVIIYGGPGTVTNTGAIIGTSNYGVKLAVGGTITNTGGTIKGTLGISIVGAGTVTNTGQITGTSATGIEINGNGTVTNTGGTIQGLGGVGVAVLGFGTVTNTGLIKSGANFFAAALYAGGTVFNQAGTIAGGVNIVGGAGTVTNYSVIKDYIGTAVDLASGFTNRVRIRPGASFSGAVNGGNIAGATSASTIELLSAAGAGTINGIGSEYQDFKNITVDSGASWTIGSSGSIAAYQTLVDSGTVTNEVFIASEITLTNGTFINASGYLSGDYGVVGPSGTNVVVNNSNIRAAQIGVSFATAGQVTNQSDGFIGGRIGVFMAEGPGASVVNQGLIEGYTAVYLNGGGSVDNQSGLISGRVGVIISGGNGTVRNAGTIASVGDYGVILPDHGVNRLVLVPGSTIAGLVHGGLADTGTSFSTMELASGSSAGTIGGIGSKYFNFVDLTVDSGAAWTFAAGQTIAANQTLTDSGTLTNDASVLSGIVLSAGAVLTNASGATVSAAAAIQGLSLIGPTTVVNDGMIAGSQAAGYGIRLTTGGGRVTNKADGTITAQGGVYLDGASDAVVNYGLIHGPGIDVYLLHGGSVTNHVGGTIEGIPAISVFGGAGTVMNSGVIVGYGGTAVSFSAGFQNRLAISPGAAFIGTVNGGNMIGGAVASTLELTTGTSGGRIGTVGLIGTLGAPGPIQPSYVNFADIVVDPGASWALAGNQTLAANETLADSGTLTNNGDVLAPVLLGPGAALTNASGAAISAADAVIGFFGSANPERVVNYGLIDGGVSNYGVVLSGAASVTNHGGTIAGSQGIVLTGGGAGTVTNTGTIAGGDGTAVLLTAGFQNRVIVGVGAVFDGTVDGGNAIGAAQASTLEFAPGTVAGTIRGLNGAYIDFAQITIDAGASWIATGMPSLVSGTTLTNAGALTLAFSSFSDDGSVINNGLIQENLGALTIGTLSGTGEVLVGAGSTLTASGSVAAGETVDLAGTGLLALAPASFSGQIDGLLQGGSIALSGITDAYAAGIVNGNTLAIEQTGGPTLDLTLDPTESYAGVAFPIATRGGQQFISAAGQAGPTIIGQTETVGVTGAEGSALAAVSGGLGGIIVTDANSRLITSTNAFTLGATGLGSLAVEAGGSVTAQAGAVIAEAVGASGSANVLGAGSNWQVVGAMEVGQAGSGQLFVSQGATVTADSVDEAASSGGDGAIAVTDSGSTLGVTGLLDVGLAGSGALQLSGGATVSAASLDAGVSTSAVGQIDLTGAGTSLNITGNATVADSGTGLLSIVSGATFSGTSLTIGDQSGSSGALIVSGAGSALNLSGALNIGTALGIGDLTVGPGAAIHASVVNLNGQVVLEGGLLDPSVQIISQGQTAGGFGTVLADDIIDEGVIQAGGAKADEGLLLVEGTVLGGGKWSENGKAQKSETAGQLHINQGGTLELTGAVLNAATTTFMDDLTIPNSYTLTKSVVDVSFDASGPGILQLDDVAGFAGTVAAMFQGDEISVTGGTLSGLGISNGNTLTVADSGAGARAGGVDTIVFSSGVTADEFSILNGNTVQFVACFAAGTGIGTVDGRVRVEDLCVGDRVVLADGGDAPVVWIGTRAVDCARHPRPETVWPVRVAAGAFGIGVPARTLFLSPDHAVFVDGVLVPVRLLVNGGSITQVERRAVTYYHVELPRHEVIVAEGLAVESYLDVGDRGNFGDADGVVRLFPDFGAGLGANAARVWEMRGAAELVIAGEKLAAVLRGKHA